MSQLQNDIDRRVGERFQQWIRDSQALYDMAELDEHASTCHMVYCMLSSASYALNCLGLEPAFAAKYFMELYHVNHARVERLRKEEAAK